MQSGGRDGSMPSHVRDSLEQDLKNLQGLKNSLDAQRPCGAGKTLLTRPVASFCLLATWRFISRTTSNIRSVF